MSIKLKMDIQIRMSVSTLMPKKTNLIEQTLVKDIMEKTSLSQQDMEDAEFEVLAVDGDKQTLKWNREKDTGKEIDFTILEIRFLKKRIALMDKNGTIELEMVPICVMINAVNETPSIDETPDKEIPPLA